jgi:hypothetical protein
MFLSTVVTRRALRRMHIYIGFTHILHIESTIVRDYDKLLRYEYRINPIDSNNEFFIHY